MSQSKRKRSPWLYLLLGLMIISLVGFGIFPLAISFLNSNNFLVKSASATTSTSNDPANDELELQAKGYQLVLNREPDNQTALRGLIEIRLQQGNIKGTIEPLADLAKLNPDIIDYGILLAQTQQQVGNYEDAIATYQDILDVHPESIFALQGIVNLFLDREFPDKAIALLQKSIESAKEINSAKSDAIDVIAMDLLLGQVYAFSEDYDKAIATYDKAIELNENDFRPLVSKALILQQQGDLEAAKSLFTKAITLAPEHQKQIEEMAGESLEFETEAKKDESIATEKTQEDIKANKNIENKIDTTSEKSAVENTKESKSESSEIEVKQDN